MKRKFVILANNKLSHFWENWKKGLDTLFSRIRFHNKISISDNFNQDLVVAWNLEPSLSIPSLTILDHSNFNVNTKTAGEGIKDTKTTAYTQPVMACILWTFGIRFLISWSTRFCYVYLFKPFYSRRKM